MSFKPVTTAADLATLDSVDILWGYRDGFENPDDPEPGENRGRAYWHGWMNGRADKKGVPRPECIALIKDMKRVGMPFGGKPEDVKATFDELWRRQEAE